MEQHSNILLKHNIKVNLLDGAFFEFAIGLASFSTVIPLFVSLFTNSAILIGLIPAIHGVGWQLPQLLTANSVSRQTRYKPWVVWMTLNERLPFLGLALVAWLMPRLSSQTALLLIFALLVWQGLGGGFTATAWQSMIAKIMPGDRRGTFFGAQSAVANLLASLGAFLAGLFLQYLGNQYGYALCFALAASLMLVSLIFLAQTRELAAPPIAETITAGAFWKSLPAILRRDRNFCWFVVARMFSQLATMGFAFYTVYAVRHHGMSEFEVGLLTSVLLGAQIGANLLLGWIGDRWGHRLAMEIGGLAAIGSSLLAWAAPGPRWFYLVIILAGVAYAAIWTIALAMNLEFGSEAERPTYIGLSNTLTAPVTILAPFLGGWLADSAGYPSAFLASGFAGLLFVLTLHFAVRPPAKVTVLIEPARLDTTSD